MEGEKSKRLAKIKQKRGMFVMKASLKEVVKFKIRRKSNYLIPWHGGNEEEQTTVLSLGK